MSIQNQTSGIQGGGLRSEENRKAIRFDSRFINEITAVAQSMPQRQCEWMSSVGIRKQFADCYDLPTIEKLEDLFWIVAQGKAQAARAGVTL